MFTTWPLARIRGDAEIEKARRTRGTFAKKSFLFLGRRLGKWKIMRLPTNTIMNICAGETLKRG